MPLNRREAKRVAGMQSHEELFVLARTLKDVAQEAQSATFAEPLDAIEKAVETAGKAFSEFWMGYHSRVYYANLRTPPSGACFSQEWGLMDTYGTGHGSRGDWKEFDPKTIEKHIAKFAGNPDLTAARMISQRGVATFSSAKASALSILESELAERPDRFLEKLKGEIEGMKPLSPPEVMAGFMMRQQGTVIIRDVRAANQGTQTPPHIVPLAEVVSLRDTLRVCTEAADAITQAASHLERQSRRRMAHERVGTNVFIGHGQSLVWRELKDFISGRVGLPWDEFNRVPIAGITNISRLSEMLDAAAIAFLVMTAEDEMADGAMQARMNVVHEAGLFQGRLGFTKAIVVFEEGCAEFSNIDGLGQLRFPKGKISAIFEDVRQVLEREGLI